MEPPLTAPSIICVTGAAGYIGTYVAQTLIERGHQVRGTVRDLSQKNRIAHLERMGVELHEADLLEPGSFDGAIAGSRFVVHTATAVRSTSKDPQRDIVDPAVDGTRNILEAAQRARTVERVVLTSSAAALIDGARPEDGHVFTEEDWNESATPETAAYDFAKREAERMAILPTMVFGPVAAEQHLQTTPGVIRDLLSGKYPAAPNLTFGIVDVRDVAAAHARALELERPSPRYLCYSESLSILEVCQELRRIEPRCRAPRFQMPDAAMYLVALVDRRLTWSFLRRNLGRRRKMDNSKLRTELGITPRSAKESLESAVHSLIEGKYVRLRA